MKRNNYKEYEYSSYWTEDDNAILFLEYKPNLIIDLDAAKEIVRTRLEYTQGKSTYILIDFTNVKSVSKGARDYMNDTKGGLTGILGGAFLSNNMVGNLFINLYLNINKPSVPAKFFTNKNDALYWLNKIKTEKVNQ
jgi:hypothetical protein